MDVNPVKFNKFLYDTQLVMVLQLVNPLGIAKNKQYYNCSVCSSGSADTTPLEKFASEFGTTAVSNLSSK